MVDGAGAADSRRIGRLAVFDPAAAGVGARVPAAVLQLEAERREERFARTAVGADALEALQRQLRGISGWRATSGASSTCATTSSCASPSGLVKRSDSPAGSTS
jgi:hypothetical protein